MWYARSTQHAIPPGQLMSTSESWAVNGHTTRCTSPESVVLSFQLASGWVALAHRSHWVRTEPKNSWSAVLHSTIPYWRTAILLQQRNGWQRTWTNSQKSNHTWPISYWGTISPTYA